MVRELSESTQKLFDAIDNANLEGFKQAMAEGADVNAFDQEGMTPLMSIANACAVSGDVQPTLEKMAKLLIQNRSIDINTQSKQVISEEQWQYTDDFQGVVSSRFRPTDRMRKDTALHIACQVGARGIVKILLTHPDVKIDVKNCEDKSPLGCVTRAFEKTIELGFEKAQKGKELLTALSDENIYQAKRLLNEELNPSCWKRNQDGEIETPLSLIIKSYAQIITKDKEEVLTKLLKHKDLDFSFEQFVQELVDEFESTEAQLTEKDKEEVLTKLLKHKDLDFSFEQFVQELVNELESTEAQLAEKEKRIDDLTEEV
ncbi:ankyrin repeat domain-containing protein [Candidatus Wolbachia massiliensis]|uniref:Ankyrin repeat domain-containing protein n=1 Tax=Candidatus Wolbachia massiliensis TaxID=1845000 RepID=A0A7M3U2K4_9RICK|nr:ankyrin repeat domain-containing protein [Candidatus Wolbachia massiliensis]QOD38639.1 ankyrin repeat domain-containing protein [Candidatus Wolbachia massiliensis]